MLGGRLQGMRPRDCHFWNLKVITLAHPKYYSHERDFEQITTSPTHTCALRSNGKIVCKGRGESGQIPDPDETYLAVSADWDVTCGLKSDRTVSCWRSGYDRSQRDGGEWSDIQVDRPQAAGYDSGDIVCWDTGLCDIYAWRTLQFGKRKRMGRSRLRSDSARKSVLL